MDIYSKSMDKLITRLSVRYGISKKEVREIIATEFYFVKKKMKDIDNEGNHWPFVRLINLGTFKVKEGKKKFFTEKAKK